MHQNKNSRTFAHLKDEQGQSLVIIAFLIIGLIAFVGLAIDVGFVYARRAQLTGAVDAAALAGAPELIHAGGLALADKKAGQYLHANGLPSAAITDTFQSSASTTVIGARQYSITVTWPIELFFLKVIGQQQVNITESATAAYFPVADIYASRRVEDGALSTSNQSVFGPNICTSYGDPVSPLNSPWWSEQEGVYNYRIRIPPDYPSNILRVELFDPDSKNRGVSDQTVAHTAAWVNAGNPPLEDLNCDVDDKRFVCLISTNEVSLGLPIDQINPWWFVRIDENRGQGSAPGNGTCGVTTNYSTAYNTTTRYTLSYFAIQPSGQIDIRELANYTGQADDNFRDFDKLHGTAYADHQTDLHWISPGGAEVFDQPATVPTDCGSLNGGYSIVGTDFDSNGTDDSRCPGQPYSPPGLGRGFDINLDNYPDMLIESTTGNRYIYLDVKALSGASENGFEIWAGPPDYVNSVSSNVNVRNIQIINNPGSHSSRGATVYGMGRLPMNSNYANYVDIPLIYLGPEYAGELVQVSLFDPDAGAEPPIHFFFDSISENDYMVSYGAGTDPDGRCFDGGSSYADECNNNWVDPAFLVQIPDLNNACTTTGAVEDCTPFYGGRLMARYKGGVNDTYSWRITITGLPYLVK